MWFYLRLKHCGAGKSTMYHAVWRKGAYTVSLCGEAGGEIIFERTDSWGRTGDWGAVETIWILNNCSKKFSRESTRGLPSCSASPAEVQLPRASEIIYFHRIQRKCISQAYYQNRLFVFHQEENKGKHAGSLQCDRGLWAFSLSQKLLSHLEDLQHPKWKWTLLQVVCGWLRTET